MRPLGLDIDFSEPLLSPDLEWMLRGNQASVAMIVEAIIQEHYSDLYRLAFSLLNDPEQARECVAETLCLAADKTHHDLGEVSVQTWLYSLLIGKCIKKPKDFRSNASDNHRYGSSAIYARNADISGCLDGMDPVERLVIMLYYQHNLSNSEIAYILKSTEGDIQLEISRLKSDFSSCIDAISKRPYSSRAGIQAVIDKRCPAIELDEGTRELLIAKVVAVVHSQRRRRRRFTTVMQLLLTGAVLIFIAALGWLTNRMSDLAGSRLFVNTVIVTKVVYIESTVESESTNNGAPNPEPLDESASFDDVFMRMRDNTHTWNTIWLDGRIIEYGPPGYVGTPLVRREQVWLDKPNRALVLSGWAGGVADRVHYFSNRLESDFNLHQSSPFTSFIFPYRFEFTGENHRITTGDLVSGRRTIILEGFRVDESLAERLWVDVVTGVTLRWQRFASDGTSLLSEIVVREIVYDAAFPETIIDRRQPVLHFSQGYSGERYSISEEYPTPRRTPAPGHSPLPRMTPPVGYDFSNSPLYFQWNQSPPSDNVLLGIQNRNREEVSEEEYGGDVPVDVFAGDYYLGQVIFNPWEARCVRSADGKLAAIISLTGNRDAPEYHLHWFVLGDIYTQAKLALDISTFGPALEIALYGRRLTFSACVGKPGAEECGVYLADLQLGSYSIFHPITQVYDLVWSSDGKILEMWTYLTPWESQKGVFEIETGELLYAGTVYRDNPQFYFDLPRRSDGYILGSIGRNGCFP